MQSLKLNKAMIMKRIILILFLGFFCYAVKAQISTEEIPYSWGKGNNKIMVQTIPKITLPHLDMKVINKEEFEKEDFGAYPLRFGFSHNVNFDLSNSGVWQTISDGGRLWNLRIYSPDALSLNLLYDKFWLPDGAKFFIYSEDTKQHIGAFTSENNQGNRDSIMGFATGFLFTNSIILEYYEPKDVENNGIISITQVISGYRYIYEIVEKENQYKHNNTEFNCHNDVNCFASYRNEKNAVAYMVMGDRMCTGALLNTTANDNRPVFLSANHCFVSSPSTSQWIFYWNYEAMCGGVVDKDPNKSTVGANVLARGVDSDFMLLNLTSNPATNSNITLYYLGWDRTTASATSGACIHHPRGAQKKISITTQTINNYPIRMFWKGANGQIESETPPNTHWKVDFTNGAVEKGSSGSPLLNQNKRVIGQCHGGTFGCSPITQYYGRFDVSWNDSSSNTRLKDWLDPIGINPIAIDGMNKIAIIGANDVCCSGSAFTLDKIPYGAIYWSVIGPFAVSPTMGTSTTVTRTSASGSSGILIARIGSSNGIVLAIKIITACPAYFLTNRTITSNTTIQSSNICVKNVTVTNNAKLTLNASNEVVIDNDFEVAIGAELEIP
jgi:hypothetical protein